nr:MAG TPA: Cytochrome c oxidase subunit 1 [Caudoviricetes sp.]
MMLDEVYDWGAKVVAAGTIMICVSLACLAGCVFYYGVHV